MKKNLAVAEAFVEKKSAKNRHLVSDGVSLRSYGWWEMARWTENGLVVRVGESYSPSTSIQFRDLDSAIRSKQKPGNYFGGPGCATIENGAITPTQERELKYCPPIAPGYHDSTMESVKQFVEWLGILRTGYTVDVSPFGEAWAVTVIPDNKLLAPNHLDVSSGVLRVKSKDSLGSLQAALVIRSLCNGTKKRMVKLTLGGFEIEHKALKEMCKQAFAENQKIHPAV